MQRMKLLVCMGVLAFFWRCNSPSGPDLERDTVYVPIETTTDTTKLVLVSTNPPDGAVGEAARNYEGMYRGMGGEVSGSDGSVTIGEYQFELVFNNPIDGDNVYDAISISTESETRFRLEEIFSPNDNALRIHTRYYGYTVGETYRLQIDTTLRDVYGNTLDSGVSLSYQPEPSFRPTNVYLLGFTNHDRSADFTTRNAGSLIVIDSVAPWFDGGLIRFNSWLDDSLFNDHIDSPSLPLHASVDTDGWMMLSPTQDSGIVLQPQSRHTITIKDGIQDRKGNHLPEDFVITMVVDSFRGWPIGAHFWGSELVARMSFNSSIDSASVAGAIRVLPEIGIQPELQVEKRSSIVRIKYSGVLESQAKNMKIQVTPFTNKFGQVLADTVEVTLEE